ncbi:MAG TPA: hypothetical protein VGM90_31005 [Kofleriaceae bacterium]|jgi:hypothetical protein
MRSLAVAAVWAELLAACGDGGSSPDIDGGVDARPEFQCWPSIAPIPRGTLELGKGGTAFAEMPDTLNLEYGVTGGFRLNVRTRMSGFDPGVPGTTVDVRNPATRVRARFVDFDAPLQLPGDCGDRGSYAPSAVGSYDYVSELVVFFNTCWGTDVLVGKQIELTAELKNATGSYATDHKFVTVADSLDPYGHNVPTTPGCGM